MTRQRIVFVGGRSTPGVSHDDYCCKLGRIGDRYDLSTIDKRLVEQWTADGEERSSLRELSRSVNETLLRSAMEEADVAYRPGEVESTFETLTDDDVSSGVRTETRRELSSDGVPVDDVEADFVSHQTVHSHLTDCLDVSRESASRTEQLRKDRERIQALTNRTATVCEDTLDRLERTEAIELGSFAVFTSATVLCEDCGSQYAIDELLDRGSCDCPDQK